MWWGALMMAKFVPSHSQLYWWPVLFVLSLAACFIGTYAAPPTEETVLKNFYKTVRPWGFWNPILRLVQIEDTWI